MKIADRRRYGVKQRTRTLADVAIVSRYENSEPYRDDWVGSFASEWVKLVALKLRRASPELEGAVGPAVLARGSLKLYIGFTLRLSISSLLRTRYRRECS